MCIGRTRGREGEGGAGEFGSGGVRGRGRGGENLV